MNVISHTDDCYLDSAVRHLFCSEPASFSEKNIYIELADTLLDFIILFNDKKPAESLIQLLSYTGFKSGDTLFVITDTVPADIITRFIPDTCRLIVQSAKNPLTEWLATLKFLAEIKEKNTTFNDIHKPLLTYAEKRFLNALSMAQTQNTFARASEMTAKTASSHKRNIMRKLGVHHTPQLLGYVNTRSFAQMLAHL
jgi:DNA-binding CsgD family transcriptional regulator